MSEERETLTEKELAWLARQPYRTLRRAAAEIQTLRATLLEWKQAREDEALESRMRDFR